MPKMYKWIFGKQVLWECFMEKVKVGRGTEEWVGCKQTKREWEWNPDGRTVGRNE